MVDINHQIVGMTEEAAKALLDEIHMQHRVVWRDGHYMIVTRDFKPNRVNMHIKDGIVVKSDRG